MKKIIVFTGAGISAESGISTFRDSGGLWEKYDINEVATPEGWKKNPELVLDFYNQRRKQVMEAKPNKAHLAIAELQDKYDVQVITQNIDDLHERAGSKKVLHLHGEIMKVRSTKDASLIYPLKKWQVNFGDVCELGSQLRPHIVWFGEMVPEMENANRLAKQASLFMVIGTSLNVYPAAGLVDYVDNDIPKYLIDPADVNVSHIDNVKVIKSSAVAALPKLVARILKEGF